MATVFQPKNKFVINSANGANTNVVGSGSRGLISTLAIHLVSTSFSGTIRIKSRAAGKDAADDSVPFVQVVYLARYLNGAVGTDSLVSTDISDTSIILVPASGQSIAVDCTTFTSGTMTVYVNPLEGAAA